jgi:hypothetical protein
MGNETSDLIAETLRRNDGNFFGDTLVSIEIESESGYRWKERERMSIKRDLD